MLLAAVTSLYYIGSIDLGCIWYCEYSPHP